MNIIEYKTKTGKKRYKFSIYVGKDSSTGKSILIRKSSLKSLKEAREAYLKAELAIETGEYKPIHEKRLKLSELIEMWYKVYQPTVKESTFATTKRIVNEHVVKELGNIYLDKLSVIQCQKAVDKWFRDAPGTYKKYIFYTSDAIEYAIKLEIIDKNPMKNVVRPKVKNVHKEFTNFYSKEELQRFLQYAKSYNQKAYTFFRLLAYTGLRRGEALALKWSDIDFKENVVSVKRTLTKGLGNKVIVQTPKTSSSYRKVAIDRNTASVLKDWKQEQRKQQIVININQDQVVFNRGKESIPLSDGCIVNWNNIISKQAKLKRITIHGFRHTNASLLFEAGVSMKDVQTRLGHKSVKTTMDIYTHVSKQHQNKAVEKLDNYMNG
ncbi:site-specific integrase [Lactobacillus panisapium]|uniref:tyrosine-type recombinase/integrase n=1 Tax=Lactobacillus panisapium TaxID=2012495 RepID=UPI001C6A22F0|nr:site-specific integrase [Lactobacillus panisapium]QYN54538.1 site-specific integrase [Lactobacillus panisapium]